MNEAQQMRQALADIAKIAKAASAGAPHSHAGGKASSSRADGSRDEYPSCVLKTLPGRLAIAAAQTAMKINPVNGPAFGAMPEAAMSLDVTNPLRIAVVVSKYWGPTPRQLTVSFMESTPADLRARLLTHMNEWAKSGCISFVETQGVGQVRISREGGGYWSYLGTDILHIPQDRQTMNLEAFTMDTPESEYRRVVRHETGHTMGFPHEHMRQELVALIDPNKAYEYFQQTQGWNRAMVDAQVLTPLDQKSIMGTPPDQTSIMCYQLPGSITINGNPIVGGLDVNATDAAFDAQIYPKPGAQISGATFPQKAAVDAHAKHFQPDDWPESDDVPASELALA
jgi:hypothetical protein